VNYQNEDGIPEGNLKTSLRPSILSLEVMKMIEMNTCNTTSIQYFPFFWIGIFHLFHL